MTGVKNPLPSGCCVNDGDCNDNDACTLDSCDGDTNECREILICDIPTPGGDPSQRACRVNGDCNDGNKCTNDICQSGLCLNTVNTSEEGCCDDVGDCPTFPCTTAFCNFVSHVCVYQRRLNCDISSTVSQDDSNVTPSPSPTPGSSAEEDSTDTGDIAGAIAGFVILIGLIIIFIIIVAIICVKNLIQKIRGDS